MEAQLAESIQVHSRLAQRLHLPENVINSNNAPIYDKYINEELERRLGVIETHLAELLRKDTVDTNSTLNDHHRETYYGSDLRQSAKIADCRFFLSNFNKNLRSSADLIRQIFLMGFL